jgi:hypothetical protein
VLLHPSSSIEPLAGFRGFSGSSQVHQELRNSGDAKTCSPLRLLAHLKEGGGTSNTNCRPPMPAIITTTTTHHSTNLNSDLLRTTPDIDE